MSIPGRSFVAAAAALIFLSSPGQAIELKKRPLLPYNTVSLGATAGGYLFSGSEHRQVRPVYGVRLGYDMIGTSLADSLGVEARYDFIESHATRDAAEGQSHLFRLDAAYPFIPRGTFVPLAIVGAGAMLTRTPAGSEVTPLLNYGPGLKYLLDNNLALRADLRHLLFHSHSRITSNFELTFGISYVFGRERKKKPVPPAPAVSDAGRTATKQPRPARTAEVSASTLFEIVGPGTALAGAVQQEQVAPPLAPRTLPEDSGLRAAPTAQPPDGPAEDELPRVYGREPAAALPEVTAMTVAFEGAGTAISSESLDELVALTATLNAHPFATVAISGGANDNGTVDRQGAERTRIIRQKLLLLGIAPERIRVEPVAAAGRGSAAPIALKITFDKEEPVR